MDQNFADKLEYKGWFLYYVIRFFDLTFPL